MRKSFRRLFVVETGFDYAEGGQGAQRFVISER
jgi:hypothetical protein